MELNLPILSLLENSQNILIAGAGGGFDVYGGLPLYFALTARGKTVHLANYSFVDADLARFTGKTKPIIPTLLSAVYGVRQDVSYFPEAFLADWLKTQGHTIPIWAMHNPGPMALETAYKHLIKELNIDALILVDGGVDSIMRGDEQGPGSILEDVISLLAIEELDVPVKILACIGFGTEIEEALDHYRALENMSALIKSGACYGSCMLLPQMPSFQQYEAACRYAMDAENRNKSHIHTRILPAVRGESGDYHLYSGENTRLFISPLMSLYWFWDAMAVLERSLAADMMRGSYDKDEARRNLLYGIVQAGKSRPRISGIPY